MPDILVYKAEIADGLAQAIRGNTSLSYYSQARNSPIRPLSPRVVSHLLPGMSVGAANTDQPDLHYLDSILVSTGWNLNDDVFAPGEVWAARTTPEDKPFNYAHDESDIIGHITDVVPVDDEGNILAGDMASDDLPESFHLQTGAVLYKKFEDASRQERIDKLIKEIAEGKWYVSMEALFWGFDYALLDEKTGAGKVIARSGKTAFLTKYLRAYGGPGEYEGNRIGRLLRSIVFSGKGLVEKPANPQSVILSSHARQKIVLQIPPEKELGYSAETFSHLKQPEITPEAGSMSEQTKSEVAELQAKIHSLEAALRDKDVKVIEKQLAEAKASFEQATARAAELEKQTQALTVQVKEMGDRVSADRKTTEELMTQKDAKIVELTTELTKVASEKKKQERLSLASTKLGKPADEVSLLVDRLAVLDDASFAEVLEAQAKLTITNHGKNIPTVSGLPAPMGGEPKKVATTTVGEVLDGAQPGMSVAMVTTAVPEGVSKLQADILAYCGRGKTEEK